jgi:hypothetical protein
MFTYLIKFKKNQIITFLAGDLVLFVLLTLSSSSSFIRSCSSFQAFRELALTRILLADEEDLSWLLDLDPAFGLLDLPKIIIEIQ